MYPENKQVTKAEKQSSDFKSELDTILSNPLTPENIDHYANSALDKIIHLTDRLLADYKSQTGNSSTGAETENFAYKYYHLGDVSSLLDYISEKDKEIKYLNNIIADAKVVNDVITPPEVAAAMNILGDAGTFEKPSTIPRLKTLIFILENEFNINPKDPGEFRLTKGILHDNMMRRESYYCVETPTINRTTLVCDEEGNATFVFDDVKLKELNISNQDLLSLTKEDIKDLTEHETNLGSRIVYSKNFTANIIKNLREISRNESPHIINKETLEQVHYLVPKASQDFRSVWGLSADIGIDSKTVQKVINSLGDSLGVVNKVRFGARTAQGYSPEQQERIISYLTEKGLLNNDPPEGYISARGLIVPGIGGDAVRSAIQVLGDSLGEIKEYKFGSTVAQGYSPEQQEKINNYLTEKGLINNDPPEGYISARGLSLLAHVSDGVVYRAIKELGDSLGEVRKYKFTTTIVPGYSPEQQEKITDYLTERGLFDIVSPEGYITVNGLAADIGIVDNVVRHAIQVLGDSLGEVKKYKFGTNIVQGYSPEQQERIISYLTEKGLLNNDPPEGYKSIYGISLDTNVTHGAVSKAIEALGSSLGTVKRYKFKSIVTSGYSPEQQEKIQERLRLNRLGKTALNN